MNGWLNIYKPRGISSAKAVWFVKKHFKSSKIGHTGTLDLEAEGVLPLAIGEATKLVNILMEAKKQYIFTIQFGAKTTTGDAAGEIIQVTNHFPTKDECIKICSSFLGEINQIPPAYSALKINGIRAYKLARQNKEFELKRRQIRIYTLKLLNYNQQKKHASYVVDCSKGTYIRALAEDISLFLQSLGFVIELRRTKVGIFTEQNSVNIHDLSDKSFDYIKTKCLKIEDVLDDIPVLEINELTAARVRFGQICKFENDKDHHQIWLKHQNKIIAVGSLTKGIFKSSRVFNSIENGE